MIADVVVAGAGPNGLMLACELALAGARPVVLDRLPARSGQPKANGVIGQVVRLLHQRGLHQRLLGAGEPLRPLPAFLFGALPLDLAGLDGNPLYGMGVTQSRLEAVLEERACELGVRIARGREVTGFAQDAEGVTIRLAGGREIRTRYLAGCDGAHSTVRKQAGIGFPGVNATAITSRAAHVTLPGATIRPELAEVDIPGTGPLSLYAWHRTERGAYVLMPAGPGTLMVSAMEWDGPEPGDDVPMTIGELRESFARVLGADVPMSEPAGPGPHVLRRLSGRNTRVAERYRDGRVFLVGDAAHVHSAMGAPGLNLGLQDAADLGWKLAAQVRGWAPPGLLDTYESERRPAAARVVMHSQAQLALTAPGPEVTALRELFGELLRDDGARRRVAELMAGADTGYPMPAPPHPLLGRFVPELPLDPWPDAGPLLIDFTGGLKTRHERVNVVRLDLADPPAGALLVRPDGYVAWAGSPDATLDEALRTWFGQ